MAEPEAKASGLISWTKTVRGMVDGARWERFLAAIPAETRALIENPPLPLTWLPMQSLLPIWHKANEILFDGDLDKATDVARQQIRSDLSTVYRVFIRVASPRFVAERASAIYGTYFRNNGTMRVVEQAERSIDILVEDLALPSPAIYARLRGSILGAFELTGVRNPRVRIAPGGANESRCLYRVSWD